MHEGSSSIELIKAWRYECFKQYETLLTSLPGTKKDKTSLFNGFQDGFNAALGILVRAKGK
jgi:hypothetical protein